MFSLEHPCACIKLRAREQWGSGKVLSMNNLARKIETLQAILIDRATTGRPTDEVDEQYKALRNEVISHPLLKDIAPKFLNSCRTTNEFWPLVRDVSGSYSGRREFIWSEFRPLLDRAENPPTFPADLSVSTALKTFDAESVHRVWVKALERRDTDPEGAITLARTLLETVCKHILDDHGATYDSGNSDLPSLYKAVAKTLSIAPSQHSEIVFRQILGGCTAVVEGLGAMRNRLSDAHGHGKNPVKPAPRHAELAVNLAGTMATFLVATHEARRG
jgi:hypothetical protein